MKNNFITKIIGATLAFAMMIGGAVGINAAKEAKEVNADNFSTTYNYAGKGTTWTGTNFEDASSYWKSSSDADSIASVSGIFSDKTITSDVVVTLDIATFGSGSNPSSSKFGIYADTACSTQVTAAQSGSLPTSSTYVNTRYTVSSSNASNFSDDIAIKITKGTKQIRLRSFTIAFSYTTESIASHSLTYAVGTNGVYDGITEKTFNVVEGGTHTVLSPASVGITGATSYIFTGWNDGSNTYQPTSSYTMGIEDVTLTAQWAQGVGLSYNGNGAASGSVATTYVVSGATQTVASNGFVAPANKQFKEWNTLSTGLGTSYNPGDEIQNFSSPLELFAIWEDKTHVTFVAGTDKGTSSGQNPDTVRKDDVVISCTSMNGTAAEYRFYANSTITISRDDGKIASIEFTGVKDYEISNLTVTSGGGTLTTNGYNGTWEGASQSVSFKPGAQARATTIVVNYYIGSDVNLNKSELTLVVGGSSSTIAVAEISGVTNPTYQWAASGEDCVTLTNTNTDTVTVAPKGLVFANCLVSLSVDGDNLQEPIVREVNVFVARSSSENAYNIVEAKHAIDLNNELYTNNARVAGIVSRATYYNEEDKAISYWISDDGTTANELEAYNGKGLSGADFDSIESIDIGASVIIKGNLTKHNSTYEFASGNQMESYSITAETKVSKLDSHASLSYKYNKTGNGVRDILTVATTGVSGTSYTSWSGKTGASGAVYAGQSAAGNSSIQLRTDNSNSGLITTTSGGNATKVTIVWNSNTANNRTVNIYGKDSAYTAVTELYGNNAGTLLGTIKKGTSTELTISGDYQFIGIRSASGALYIDRIDIQWGEPVHYTFSDVAIRFGGAIAPQLWEELDTNEHNIAGFGVAWKKANTFEGLLKNNIANVETADGQGFYKLVSAKAEGHPDLVNGKYIWNFYLRIPTTISEVYDEQYLDDNITAVAYIKLNNGEVVYLKETTASVKTLAQALLNDNTSGYNNSSLDGSLKYLADLTF